MRKYLLVAVLLLGAAGYVYGDTLVTSATRARAAALDKGIEQVVGVGDLSDGYSLEVNSHGAASVEEYPKQISSQTGSTLNTGTSMVGNACSVYSITCSGFGTAAGDYVLIYDASSATGTAKFECTVGTAKDTNTISIPGGAIFSTDVFADSNANTVHLAITYED